MRRASNVLLCVGLLALMAIPATALSQGGVQSGWADRPPTLNGTIGPGEWSNATRVNLHSSDVLMAAPFGGKIGGLAGREEISAEQVSGWARFMNDDRYLYVAASLNIGAPAGDPDYWETFFLLFLEDEPRIGDGKWAANLCSQNPDEGVYLSASAHYPGTDEDYDAFVPGSEEGWCWPWQHDPPGYRRAFGWGSTNFEARLDLRSSALDVAPGDCFNLGLLLIDWKLYFPPQYWEGHGAGEWPAGLIDAEEDWPDGFGQVCLAEEEEFVPEPGTMALLGAGLAGLGGYATLRWRSRRKE
jgi:hypothetical protein